MIIDANMYWMSEDIFESDKACDAFLSEIPSAYGIYGYRKDVQGKKQIVIEKPKGYQNLNYVQGEYELHRQLKDLDEAGVDKAVMKIPGAQEWMSLETCKKFNDGMYRYAKESKGRLIPLAVVPPYASEACFEELNRCKEELKFHGVQLCAHYGTRYLDNEIFQPFFEKLNEQPTTVYIHHVPVPVQYDMLYEYNNLRRSYGRCVDQTTAICRELFSGFFDKYPNLTFVHSMLGGAFFAIAHMMFPKSNKQQAVERFVQDDHIQSLFSKHVYFEMSHAQPWGKDALTCAVNVLGADHILFGTSYPVRQEWLHEGVDFVQNLPISQEEKDNILGGNAKRLYHIE